MIPNIVISGLGLEYPGIPDVSSLLELPAGPVTPEPFQAHLKLGRKGLLGKDHSTRLAMCAARSALLDAGLPATAAEQLEPESIGVVASSNLGNLDTVCKVVETLRATSVRDTSPLDAPNASSNIVASSIAIRFNCRSVNLMVCSGAGSGTDALYLAANLIRAGRAKRMIVVGVEPNNPVTAKLMAESMQAWLGTSEGLRLADGAAAVVLEAEDVARARSARPRGRLGGHGFAPALDVARSVELALGGSGTVPGLWLTPHRGYAPTAAAVEQALSRWGGRRPECRDFSAALGEAYGLLGVFQCLAACAWLEHRPEDVVLTTSGACWNDGASSLTVEGVR